MNLMYFGLTVYILVGIWIGFMTAPRVRDSGDLFAAILLVTFWPIVYGYIGILNLLRKK